MDPFEEFEFKPLTDGLGFHRKKPAAPAPSEAPTESFTFKSQIKDQGLELIEENSVDPLRPPLPRKKAPTAIPTAPGSLTEVGGDGSSSKAVDEILKTLQKTRRFEFEEKAAKAKIAATPAKEEFKPTLWNFSSSLLDGMLIVAASLLCMIILLMITKVDLVGNLTHPDEDGMIYLATFGLFATVTFIYMTVNRAFMGYTPGEWAFDQRIGTPEDMKEATFSVKVAARSLLVIVTGLIVMPILSLAMNKDVAGNITGARLLKKA